MNEWEKIMHRNVLKLKMLSLFIIVLFLMSCSKGRVEPEKSPAHKAVYDATVRWTSHGIPHVKADDWGSLGYGFAYAVAEDGLCVLADVIVTVNGERSKYFGPEDSNMASDIFHKALLDQDALNQFQEGQRGQLIELRNGYIAGYNRYLADHQGRLPNSCNNKPWVRPITEVDMNRINIGVGIRYGLGNFMGLIANASPPESHEGSMGKNKKVIDSKLNSLITGDQYGSNACAFGKAVTANGRGLLLGNPHYPWLGPSRFHMVHLTIPDELDVMGVGLFTSALVSIGFNQDIAWSHTVSTALRYTIYELKLVDGNPLAYHYGAEIRPLVPKSIFVETKSDDGEIKTVRKTVYMSHYGPVIESRDTPWDYQHAYVLRDSNFNNNRSGEQYYRIDKARSVENIVDALKLVQGTAWVNTIAADRYGNAFYGDMSVVPNVDRKLIDACRSSNSDRIFNGNSIVLDGSDPDCEWHTDGNSAVPGIMPPEKLPKLITDRYVTNSNDSYWLSNPDEKLEGYSPIIGNEGTARSLRTRAGLRFIEEVIDTGKPNPFTPDVVQDIMYSQRHYGAEIFLDDIIAICRTEPDSVEVNHSAINVADACSILASWDRRQGLNSRGAQIYTEFWNKAHTIENLNAIPFDIQDPVHTPRGINKTNPVVRRKVMGSLAAAVYNLNQAGIDLGAPWGEVQYVDRNGGKIGIPGGSGAAGMFSVIAAPLTAGKGYTPVISGNSYIQVVTWDDAGNPDARAILTYSQSQEPESPYYADQTRLYSKGQWINLPFTEAQIQSDLKKSVRLFSEPE